LTTPDRRERGFTLIEVLAAFAIAVLVLGGAYRLFGAGVRLGAAATGESRAVLIAQSAMEAIAARPLAASEASESVAGGFERTVTVRPRADLVPGPSPVPGAFPWEVDVAVTWRDGRQTRAVSLATVRLGPIP